MIRIHIKTPIVGKSFEGVKVCVLPRQSMTLQEIIARFKRKESLPVEKQAVYVEGMGDLEKAQNEDITVRMDRANELKRRIKEGEEAARQRKEKKALESAPPPPSPIGAVTGSGGSAQAPAPSPTPTQ